MNMQNRSRHTYGAGLNDMSILNNKYLKSCQPLFLESTDEVVWEYTLAQSKVTDSIAVHIGAHILSLSKLHLLKVSHSFVNMFNFSQTLVGMYTCLSFRHIRYVYGDTDSLYFATCSPTLDGCLGYPGDITHYKESEVPDLYQKWLKYKQDFLVPDQPTQEQKRRPGLWKLEYKTDPTQKAEAICLSPKCYWIGVDAKDNKHAQKGISFSAQTAGLEDFRQALYEDLIPSVDMASLRYNKESSQMAIYKIQKPALNTIYTKFFVDSDRIKCIPYTED